jgi:type IV pilus assembly protein PilQ
MVKGEGEAAAGSGEGPPITLDIENESVQDVFNSVLRVTGFAGQPSGSHHLCRHQPTELCANIVTMRTLRLNQIDATVASNFLVGLGR